MAHPDVGRRWLLVALVALLASSAFPASALAHTALRRSEPANDSSLATAPRRITLWFTAPPQATFTTIALSGPFGDVPLGAVAADTGNAVTAPIARPLTAGEYLVRWQTASADGHVIKGEIRFTVLADDPALAAAMQDAPPDSAPAAAFGATEAVHANASQYRAVRWIEFVALLTILGALGFRGIVLPAAASRGVPVADAADRARRLGQSAVALYALAAAVRLYAQSAALAGADDALSPVALRVLVTGTSWGIGWSAGAIGALLVFSGWKLSKRYGFGLALVIAGSLGLVVAPAMTGHAASETPRWLGVTLDAVHVAAAGLWVGGLLIVLFAGIPAMLRLGEARDRSVSALVHSFHPLALFCAPLVVLSGLGSTWLRLPAVDALWSTQYGQVLLVKLAFVGAVVAMGAYNSARMRRRLGTAPATRQVRLSAAAELLFAAAVVAVTSVLVVTPLPSVPPLP